MAAIILDYFGDWQTRRLTCPVCGWTGTFQEGDTELYAALQDCQCPGPHGFTDRPMLAILPFPTFDEWREHWDEISEAQRCLVRLAEAKEGIQDRD
ncbi:MAG: hypothetical protein LWW79_08740 [Holophagaceae bacterium]|nr:hypothetical protein [Holophagaceae bacterium]